MDGENVYIVNPKTGKRGYVPRAELDTYAKAGFQEESAAGTENARLQEEYGDSPLQAAAEGAARSLTFGLSDVALGQVDEEGVRERQARNQGAALAGELGGALIPVGAPGAIGGLGHAAEELVTGGKTVGRLGKALGATTRGVAEGAAYGASQGVSEVALSEDPVTVEGALTTIGTDALFGGAVGGAAGGASSLLGEAAAGAKDLASRKLQSIAGGAADQGAVKAEGMAGRALAPASEAEQKAIANGLDAYAEVAKMDRPGVRAAQKAEQGRVREWARQEASKVVDETHAYHIETQGPLAAEMPELAKSSKPIARSLEDPKGFIDSPGSTARALRIQEASLDNAIATKTLSEGGAAEAQKLLEQNRALQGRIKMVGELYQAPASPLLDALDQRVDELAGGAAKAPGGVAGIAKKAGEGAAFSATTGLLSAVGVPYPLAALAGGKVAELAGAAVGGSLTGKLARGAEDVAKRLDTALDAFAKVGQKATRSAPVLATKTLEGISFAPPTRVMARAYTPTKSSLAAATRARVDELASQVEPDPMKPGKLRLNAAAAADLHARLAGLWATQPKFADSLEAAAARRITFLAEVAPKRPASGAMPTGPDRWQPSDMDSRKLARYVDAVEHPAAVVERLADGTLTPEDAKAMREVHPGLYAKVQAGLTDRLTELRKTLPYERRLTLSIMFDVPVDESMSKPMTAALQASFTAPMPSPQMPGATQPLPGASVGKLKPSTPTAAQKTAG
jgi:hypothetical protein